jgi:adenosine deaminase
MSNKTNTTLTYNEILQWPKTDLHCHLDGSLRIETFIELARQNDVKLPSYEIEGLKETLGFGQRKTGFQNYLVLFEYALSLMQDKESIERIAFELAEDAAKENVVYLEIRYAPIFHTSLALRWSETIDAVLKGIEKAEKMYDIKCGIILTGIRSIDPVISKALAELAVQYKGKGVVGFDLAGAEDHNPAKNHAEAFYIIRNNNINCTIHAGEVAGRTSISEALHYCNADRIGQGTRLIESAGILNYVNDHRIPLEVCLSTSTIFGPLKSLEAHPFPFYHDYGLRVTLNTDSRLFADTTMTKELLLAAETFGLTEDDLKDVITNGFKSAFLPYAEKVRMMCKYLPKIGRKVPSCQATNYQD